MAGLDPAISRGPVLDEMAALCLAMTYKVVRRFGDAG
jgi:hypothetical protein